MEDSILRYNYFSEEAENNGYDNKKLDFPIHALLLLAELQSSNSLPHILRLLKQEPNFTALWFGDFLPQVMENALYYCGKDQLPALFDFLKLPNIYNINKATVGEALVKIIADSNEDRNIFVAQYREVLNVYIEKADDEKYADTEALGFLISDIIDLGYKELLPEINQLFELDIVGFWICGTYDDVESDMMEEPLKEDLEFMKLDISEKYKHLNSYEENIADSQVENSNFFDDFSDDFPNDLDHFYHGEMLKNMFSDNDYSEPIQKSKKIGRNEPCPCGSGKKYKKCCIEE